MREPDSSDVLSQLRAFIDGASRNSARRCNDLGLARTALKLLRTLAASHDALLEYLSFVFDSSVKKYVTQMENEDQHLNITVRISDEEDAVISEIYSVLSNFVSSNPEAWASVISSWSLKVLGEISSRYSRLPSMFGLNEAVRWWTSCKAAKTLVDITTLCLSCVNDIDSETCINALLDMSVAHSPDFDWVVAHVGSCFPKTVITRVLSCGLKDFSVNANSMSTSKMAKIDSVVGILSHLASSHVVCIRAALLELFQWNLTDSDRNASQKSALVPYLLLLAVKSQTLLRALSTDVLHTLNLATVYRLAEQADTWRPYFKDDMERLEDLVVQLAVHCEHGASKIVTLLLEATQCNVPSVAATCHVLLELLLEDVDCQLRSCKTVSVPFLESLRTEICQLQPLLLSSDPLTQQTMCRLVAMIGSVNLSTVVDCACYLLLQGSHASHLAALVSLTTSQPGCVDKDVLGLALEQALRHVANQNVKLLPAVSDHDFETLWQNIATLLRHEASLQGESGQVSKAVTQNLGSLSDILTNAHDLDLLDRVAGVIDLLPVLSLTSLPVQLTLALTKNTVKYFFLSVASDEEVVKTQNCRRASRLLSRFSHSPVARALALRELLETSLFSGSSRLFGARRLSRRSSVSSRYMLMEENQKLETVTAVVGQRQSSSFVNSTGGRQRPVAVPGVEPHTAELNTLHLVEAIKTCCHDTAESGSVYMDTMVQVSLLLVELISPDIMYNGLPWPEEDFCKVTVERDVHIRKMFDDLPLAWQLLELVSYSQPALCYCSVLLRALMASLLSQWGPASAQGNQQLLNITERLLKIMARGQLLPPPLSSLHDVVRKLTPHEVLMVLRDCVWCYMRDNVPCPALFTRDTRTGFMWRDPNTCRPSALYTETLRCILLNNIKDFGPLYSKLFVHM